MVEGVRVPAIPRAKPSGVPTLVGPPMVVGSRRRNQTGVTKADLDRLCIQHPDTARFARYYPSQSPFRCNGGATDRVCEFSIMQSCPLKSNSCEWPRQTLFDFAFYHLLSYRQYEEYLRRAVRRARLAFSSRLGLGHLRHRHLEGGG